jgi:DNA replication and repair protein RecF
MGIKEISLFNFRNFKKKTVGFGESTAVILGPNASGKTNLLEALSLLSTGKSFRARTEIEMVSYGREMARVKGMVDNTSLEVILTRGDNGWPKKRLLVNGVPKRLADFAGIFKTVLFGPWDMDLVTDSPSLRRSFLDGVLFQVDREYRRASLSYEKGLRQRNRLLLRIREEGLSRSPSPIILSMIEA